MLIISFSLIKLIGILQPVKNAEINITSNEVRVTWEAPFSLDLTDVDPDIIYCIQMINITCGEGSILFNNCTILDNELYLPDYSQHYAYDFIITPRSNVEGALNGTPLTVPG